MWHVVMPVTGKPQARPPPQILVHSIQVRCCEKTFLVMCCGKQNLRSAWQEVVMISDLHVVSQCCLQMEPDIPSVGNFQLGRGSCIYNPKSCS